MNRRELESILTKAASAGRSVRRHALLKSAFYASEALPKDFRSYGSFLFPLNKTVASETALTMPKAVRAQEHAQAGGVLAALGFLPAKAQAHGAGPWARVSPAPTKRKTLPPKDKLWPRSRPAATLTPREQLDQIGTNFLLAGKNLVTNPIDTLRRHFNGQPLKR